MKYFFESLEKLINTIKSNGLFILLAILSPTLLYYFGAGSEIILDLTSEKNNITNFFITISFVFIGISIWCVPTFSIILFTELTLTGKNKRIAILDKLLDIYNAKSKDKNIFQRIEIEVRYLAVLPWFIFIVILINVLCDKNYTFLSTSLILITLFALDYLVKKVHKEIEKFNLKLKEYWELKIVTLLITILFILSILSNSAVIIIITNLFGAFFLYCSLLIKENSENFPDTDPDKQHITRLIMKKTLIVHVTVLIISIASIFYLYDQQRDGTIHKISVITVINLIMSFFILIIEFLFTSQIIISMIMKKGLKDTRFRYIFYRYMISGLAIFLIGTVFNSYNLHVMRKVSMENQFKEFNGKTYEELTNRETLEEYFKKWYKKRRNKSENKDSLNLYLVSGQGGGSRAGTWFLANMYKLDSDIPDFYDNLFAISTVSGSSSGAQMFLASKEIDTLRKYNDEDHTIIKKIYKKNYLSSALYGMFIGDFIESFIGGEDRNYYFQKEEIDAFKEAIKITHEKEFNKDTILNNNIENFFNMDFMSNYKRRPYLMPLFFINSTIIENGKKVVFSPIKLNEPILNKKGNKKRIPPLTYYEDAYGIFRSCQWGKNKGLPLSACVNASQSFPLINAYGYLHGVGRLADGGIFENSGTSTTSEIYLALKEIIKTNKEYKNIKIKLITILNGKIDDEKSIYFERASILNTITALTKNPFTGHELMAVNQLNKLHALIDTTSNDTLIIKKLEGNFPLTRILSDKTINEILKEVDKE